jgi:hypothetical protein
MNIEQVLSSHGLSGKKGLIQRTGSVTLAVAGSTATIPVAYTAATEALFVFQGGTLILSPAQYTVSGTTVTKVGTAWDKGTILDFAVIGGSATPAATFDGSLLSNGTVTNLKLHTDAKVGSLATLVTTDKSSAVAAINELQTNVYGVLSDIVNNTLNS